MIAPLASVQLENHHIVYVLCCEKLHCLHLQLSRGLAKPIMPGVGVQWQADLRPVRDLEAPSGLHIGPWGKVGWNGPLVGICGNPPA